MINYEGMSYNLDAIIQFEALKKLLEALAKRQIDHNIMLYGQKKEIIDINNDNKDEKIDSNDEIKENFLEKINNIGIINDYIESKRQLMQNIKVMKNLESRIELLEQKNTKENEIDNNYVEKTENVENNDNKNNQIINKEKNIEKTNHDISVIYITTKKDEDKNEKNIIDNNIITKDNELKNNNIIPKDNELNNSNIKMNEIELSSNIDNKLIKNDENASIKEEDKNLKNEIKSLENKLKVIKMQIEKIQTLAENNKISIDLSKKEMSLFKKISEQFSQENIVDNNKLETFEKKIIKIIEVKFKELITSKFDNFNFKTFFAEKEKLKEENEKILLDLNNIKNKNIELENKIGELPDLYSIKKCKYKIIRIRNGRIPNQKGHNTYM
jgi:hypothetical protein